MSKRQVALFFGLAVLASSLGWLSLTFGFAGLDLSQSDAQSLGWLLVAFGGGYLLLSLTLAMRGLNQLPWLSDTRLAMLLSVAGFLSAVPLSLTFSLSDQPTLLIAMTFILTWPPLAFYLDHREDQ